MKRSVHIAPYSVVLHHRTPLQCDLGKQVPPTHSRIFEKTSPSLFPQVSVKGWLLKAGEPVCLP